MDNGVIDNEAANDAICAAWSDNRARTGSTLDDWLNRCPDQAAELIEWATFAPVLSDEAASAVDDEAEARILALGSQVIETMRSKLQPTPASLLGTARQRGLTIDDLVERLQLGESVIFKLERRLLHLATIPAGLIERLAGTLELTTAQVGAYLRLPGTLSTSASYKADRPPKLGPPQSFADAIRTCPEMTPEQRAFWLNR